MSPWKPTSTMSSKFAQHYLEKKQFEALPPTPHVVELPIEVWEQILFLCTFRIILCSRLWSKCFNLIVRQSTMLQCKIEFDAAGIIPPSSSRCIVELQKLRKLEIAWKAPKLHPVHRTRTRTPDIRFRYEQSASLEYPLIALIDDNVLQVTQLNSMNSPDNAWQIDYPKGFSAFAFDSRQDLLILFTRGTPSGVATQALSLRRGSPHPRAPYSTEVDWGQYNVFNISYRDHNAQIAGNHVALRITEEESPWQSAVVVINWVTGCMQGKILQQPFGVSTQCFRLISPNCLLFQCVGRSGDQPPAMRNLKNPTSPLSARIRIYRLPDNSSPTSEEPLLVGTLLLPEMMADVYIDSTNIHSTLFKTASTSPILDAHHDAVCETLWTAGILALDLKVVYNLSRSSANTYRAWRFVTPLSTFLPESGPSITAYPKCISGEKQWEDWGPLATRIIPLVGPDLGGRPIIGGYRLIMASSAFDFNPFRVRRDTAVEQSLREKIGGDGFKTHTKPTTIRVRSKEKGFARDVVCCLPYSEGTGIPELGWGFRFLSEQILLKSYFVEGKIRTDLFSILQNEESDTGACT